MALLELERLSKRFGDRLVLNDCSLSVKPGETVVLLGPTGSGKSTALRLAVGLDAPDRGRVIHRGSDVTSTPSGRRGMAYLPQGQSLWPAWSVRRNLELALSTRRREETWWRAWSRSSHTHSSEIETIAKRWGLLAFLERLPDQLSGGEARRAALARSLSAGESTILLDEPFSHLDAPLRRELWEATRETIAERRAASLMVTHDQDEALSLGHRVAVLFDGQMRQFDAPETLYDWPNHRQVAAFLGDPPMNLLDGIIERVDGATFLASGVDRIPLPNAGPLEGDRRWTIGVRAEHVKVASFPPPIGSMTFEGVLTSNEFRGDSIRWQWKIGAWRMAMTTSRGAAFPLHEVIRGFVAPEHLRFFDASGRSIPLEGPSS